VIEVDSLPSQYRGIARNKNHELATDAPLAKGGGGMGFGAHELLEASFAVCMNMAVRMYADQHGFPLGHVSTRVSLSWPDANTSRFEYSLELTGSLSDQQRAELEAIAEHCPVRQTLSKQLKFERSNGQG
jgi:putative redox protein